MESAKQRRKKILMLKAWERWRSRKKAPEGCFAVYVGAQRQRFVVKTEYVNHPLFKKLLDDAELEYGFASDGPIWLPCNVDLFCRVLAEMDGEEDDEDATVLNPSRPRSFMEGYYSSFALCSPAPTRLLCNVSSVDDDPSSCAYTLLGSKLL